MAYSFHDVLKTSPGRSWNCPVCSQRHSFQFVWCWTFGAWPGRENSGFCFFLFAWNLQAKICDHFYIYSNGFVWCLGSILCCEILQVVFPTFARANHSCLPNCTLVDGQSRLSGLVVAFFCRCFAAASLLFAFNHLILQKVCKFGRFGRWWCWYTACCASHKPGWGILHSQREVVEAVFACFCSESAGRRKSLSPTWMMQGYSWTFPLGRRSFRETFVGFLVSMFISIAAYTL